MSANNDEITQSINSIETYKEQAKIWFVHSKKSNVKIYIINNSLETAYGKSKDLVCKIKELLWKLNGTI